MRNRHSNNAVETNISQNELNSLTQEVKELAKKRDFDKFAMMQVRATTQVMKDRGRYGRNGQPAKGISR